MSVLHWGDDEMHYSDSSHRWIAPENVEQSLWDAGLRAHLAQHLSTMGGSVRHDEQRERWSRRSAELRAERTARTRRALHLVNGDAESDKPAA